MKFLEFIAVVLLLGSCQQAPTSVQEKAIQKQKMLAALPEKQTKDSEKVECTERDSLVEGVEDPIIIKQCSFGKYRTLSIGEADYKGRYAYRYRLEMKTTGGYKGIDNASMFLNQEELLRLINDKLNSEYLSLKQDPETAECLQHLEEFLPLKSLNNLQLEFSKDAINFNYSFGLSDACLNVDGVIISFKLNEISKFIQK